MVSLSAYGSHQVHCCGRRYRKPLRLVSGYAAGMATMVSTERYIRIGGKLGRGSYGVVQCAWDNQLQCVCAIKVQNADSPDAARELHFLKCVGEEHENVVHLKDVFLKDGKMHTVFEYCEWDLYNAWLRAGAVIVHFPMTYIKGEGGNRPRVRLYTCAGCRALHRASASERASGCARGSVSSLQVNTWTSIGWSGIACTSAAQSGFSMVSSELHTVI